MKEKNKAVSSYRDFLLRKKKNLKEISNYPKNPPEDFAAFPRPPAFPRERHVHKTFFLYMLY